MISFSAVSNLILPPCTVHMLILLHLFVSVDVFLNRTSAGYTAGGKHKSLKVECRCSVALVCLQEHSVLATRQR